MDAPETDAGAPALHPDRRGAARDRPLRRAGGAGAGARPALPGADRRERERLRPVARRRRGDAPRRARGVDVLRPEHPRAAPGAGGASRAAARVHRHRRGDRRAVRLYGPAVRRAGRHGRDLARRLPDLQLPRRGLWRAAGHGALSRRCRGPGGAGRGPRASIARSWSSWPTPTTRWASGTARSASRRCSTRCPTGTLLCLDEAYVEFAPEGTAPRLGPGRCARDPVPHLLQGLRPGRAAHRLCGDAPGDRRGLRPRAQPFRRQPDRAGGGAARRSATGAHLASVVARRGRGARGGSPRSPRRTGWRRCPRRRTSSPSTAAATAISPARCCAS